MSPKTEMLLAALRQENNRYLAAIANVSAVVGELAEAVEVLQRQLGGCNVAATQALRVAGGADIAGDVVVSRHRSPFASKVPGHVHDIVSLGLS